MRKAMAFHGTVKQVTEYIQYLVDSGVTLEQIFESGGD